MRQAPPPPAPAEAQQLLKVSATSGITLSTPTSAASGRGTGTLASALAGTRPPAMSGDGGRAGAARTSLRGHLSGLLGGLTRRTSASPAPRQKPQAGDSGAYPGGASSTSSSRNTPVVVGSETSPVGAACGCMPVGGRAVSAGQLLKRWRGTGNDDERSLREFFAVMLGETSFDPFIRAPVHASHPHGTDAVEDDSSNRMLCLEELNAEKARAFCGDRSWLSGGGLMHNLRPHLEDLITRKQGLRGAVDLLATAVDGDADLPKVMTELTAKDLFLALLYVVPRRSRARLAAAYANLRVPLPIVFRGAAVPHGGLRTLAPFDILQELACVPYRSRTLIMSTGTQKLVGAGKTALLAAMSLAPAAEDSLDVRPAGPSHAGSCDLLCADPDLWVLDVHGHWQGLDDESRAAALAMATTGRAICLVHCSMADFHHKTGVVQRELSTLLASLMNTTVLVDKQVLLEPACSRGSILLVRDVTPEAWAPRGAAIEAALRSFNILGVIPVEDCRSFRSAARRTAAVERYRGLIHEAIKRAAPLTDAVACGPEELQSAYQSLLDGGISGGTVPGGSASAVGSQSSGAASNRERTLGDEFVAMLDKAQATCAASSTLFPLSAVNRRLTALRREEVSSGGSRGAVGSGSAGAAENGGIRDGNTIGSTTSLGGDGTARGTRLEQLRLEENQARARAAEISKLENELASAHPSVALEFFRNVMTSATADRRNAVAIELALRLDAWKEPLVLPLLERQRQLIDRQNAGAAASNANAVGAIGSGARDDPMDKDKRALAEVADRLAEMDFSMDSFWSELELMMQRRPKESQLDFARERACWKSLLVDGQPFQLLHDRPLQMAGGFLRSVLDAIGAPRDAVESGIFVVSVIGAQSSAKSTLLNFLFGCGFAVSAGRCTRGLYASYFKPGNGRKPMLVLDSEGLLSLGSEGGAFDGQIALMCMTCSHLVLVNHKGELSRQLQDLLEVSLFAMRHLRLARLQPRLVFVLRDQHDRGRSVHEDMLKQMRNHLEDAARTLGTPLKDLILLDGTAVFLLPSAVTSELRQGKEVCWTSELFAREVLHLRSEVFRWLREDAARRAADGGGPLEFSSLAHWYDHASAAWDTLVQFGEQLLHYKTIHEIELRRELADVAKIAVRDALDGADGTAQGFHARARQMVDSFVSRIHASPTRLDLETTDLELGRALACLRDECVGRLEESFQERASDPRFGETAKDQAKQQLRTPIEWAYENHLYTWKLHLKKASDERAMHELWVHFTGVLNRHLARSSHRSCLSEVESKDLFNGEWSAYESSYLDRLRSLTKDWQTLAHEVTLLFNHAVAKLQHEAGTLALLKEIGPQQVAVASPERRRAGGVPSILEQTDEEWEELYFHVGWWASMKARGLALLQNGVDTQADLTGTTALRGIVIPRMRQVVQQGLQQYCVDVRNRGALDEATAADGLRHITGVVLQDIEARLLAECSATLKRPQILHALHVALRLSCVEALVGIEDDKQQKSMTDLLAQKALVEEHFLLIVQANKGDVERATNFATLYHRQLMNWLDHEVMQLAAEVRSQVLQEMPDPQKSSERAFQRSFAARSWPDVLEYVIDMNAYLEKLYLIVFHQKKQAYVETARLRLEKRILATYQLLQEVTNRWAQRESGSDDAAAGAGAVKDVVRGPTAANAQRSVRELKDFIVAHAERVPKTADSAESHRQLAERLPATADFQVADPKLFTEALQARVGDFVTGSEIPTRLRDLLEKSLQEQSLQAWSLIRGCSERCPLCGSKCDLVGEHARHHCAHHLFPAFHGWMDRSTGLPSFNHCLSCSSRDGTYECKDGVWRKLEDYLKSDHPAWLPFITDHAAGSKDVQHLRAAWVHCREPLLEYFSPMSDSCPQEWIEAHQGEGKPLTKADLATAKDTIRKLRAKTWKPVLD